MICMGYHIRQKFVRETKKEKELYEKCDKYERENPFRMLTAQMDSVEKIRDFFSMKVSEIIELSVPLAGTRWSIHANEKQTQSYSVAGFTSFITFNVLDCICQWAANDTCKVYTDVCADKIAKNNDCIGEYTKFQLIGPGKSVVVSLVLEPCTVPKKIKNSRTDGIQIKQILWESDCTLGEFFGKETAKYMQETLLNVWFASAISENSPKAYWNNTEETIQQAERIQKITQDYLEQQELLSV